MQGHYIHKASSVVIMCLFSAWLSCCRTFSRLQNTTISSIPGFVLQKWMTSLNCIIGSLMTRLCFTTDSLESTVSYAFYIISIFLPGKVVMPKVRKRRHYKMRHNVCLSVCHVPQPKSRTERPGKPKIGTIEVCRTSNPWTCLEVKGQRSRSLGRLMQTETMIGRNSSDAKVWKWKQIPLNK